jgi:hypothetical protein
MATGSFARSFQPSTRVSIASFPSSQASTLVPLYNRVRTQGRPIGDTKTDSEEPKSKQAKSTDMEIEALELFVALMKNQKGTETRIERVRLNTFKLAIQLLQDEYELRLSESHFLQAVEFLESQSKAFIFITLKSRLQDQWHSKNAEIELFNTIDSTLNI